MPKLTSVLLVDDDSTTNYLNKLLLNRLGVAEHLLVAENGREALPILAQTCRATNTSCPPLILLDVNMPLMNGFEFLVAYRELPPALQSATVVVMLTTSLHPRDVARAQSLPVAGFLTKPLTAAKVTEIIQGHFAGTLAAPIPEN